MARTLERQWEEKLAAQQHLEEEYHRFLRQQPRGVAAAEREAIRQLAADIPALWGAATTTAADRKELVRQVVTRVMVDAQGASEQVRVTIDWVGGGQTAGLVVRPVAQLADLSYYPQLCARVRTLVGAGLASAAIAQRLNEEGYRPPKRGASFGAQGVAALRRRLGLTHHRPRPVPRDGLGPDEWWRSDLAQALGIPRSTLENWIRYGWVTARQQDQPPRRWVIRADPAEMARLRQLHRRSLGDEARRRWTAKSAETSAERI